MPGGDTAPARDDTDGMQTPPPQPPPVPRRTWRILDDRRLPALEPFADTVRRLEPVVLREGVWDTDDRVLAAAGVELLGSDTGWALDRGDGPVELGPDYDGPDQTPDPGAPVPPRDAVEVFLRGRELRRVRIRDTVTTLVQLLGKDGRVRAEVADVRVDEGDPDTALLRSARWWALTDDAAGTAAARAVERALDDHALDGSPAGDRARPPGSVPTPAGDRATAVQGGASRRPRRGTAAAFVVGVLRALRSDLLAVDPRVRGDEPESVHELRKVLRRLRSVLAVYRGALDRGTTERLRTELAEVSRVAGTARDAEVLRDRVVRAAARTPGDLVDAATLDAITARLEQGRAAAAAALRAALRSDGWFAALDHLDDLISRAPAGPRADQDGGVFIARRLDHDRERLSRTTARRGGDLADLHEVRKAARRLRYSLDAAGGRPDVGKRRLDRLRRMQETLGEVLDASHAVEDHRRAATDAAAHGEDTFGYGVLAATEARVVAHERKRAERWLDRL